MAEPRLVFMGTPAYAVPSLEALIGAGFDVICVYTQPARPAGRGKQPQASPVEACAAAAGIPVRTPASLKDEAAQRDFAALNSDLAVVVAYGLILPAPILAAPRLGCINAHASLLPRWRGAAPIQRAIMAGDAETGVTIMQMDAGLDTGPVLCERRVAIDDGMTASALHDRLAALSADLLVEAIPKLVAGDLNPRPQPEAGVTYAKKINKAEARIDWRRAASELAHTVHALSPVPGAWFQHDDARIKVLAAESEPGEAADEPGLVVESDGLVVACAAGTRLRALRLQRAGKAPIDAAAFLRGHAIPAGTRLPCPATS